MTNKFEEKVISGLKKQTQSVIDKIHPPFDHHKPDTDNNKKRFIDFIKIEITQDVKNIYCFDDAIGIDGDYMFAFNCKTSTSEK